MRIHVPIVLDLPDEYFDRRTIVRALLDERRAVEDARSPTMNYLDDPRVSMLISLTRRLHLDPLETIEALGNELVSERLWMQAPEDVESSMVLLKEMQ